MPPTLGISKGLDQPLTPAPESGSEISDMSISNEFVIEAESLEHENNKDPPLLPECPLQPTIGGTKGNLSGSKTTFWPNWTPFGHQIPRAQNGHKTTLDHFWP
ncbi:hypothetical protein O181_003666 [Austropuccinia psidii MF-1]|uniref:Uncharacterized protein n=1 Tax=Austropuccinia psidii MF-1 TaxID=1389203 RepID=A0A9Q3BE45_9BASI|nr:hypothetical protein [Austropuccinia psidii MF-1]